YAGRTGAPWPIRSSHSATLRFETTRRRQMNSMKNLDRDQIEDGKRVWTAPTLRQQSMSVTAQSSAKGSDGNSSAQYSFFP
ncbi:MAG: hypothetical protein ACO307_15355, partial [Ilumatobacteraceae bacterium]